MADETIISEIVDQERINRQVKDTLTGVEAIIDALQEARALRIDVQGSDKSTAELQKLSKALDIQIKQTKQAGLEALNEAKAREANAKAIQQEERARQQSVKTQQAETRVKDQAARATANEKKLIDQAINDYYQLSQAYNEAALKAKNYVLRLGENHPIAVEAIKDANDLGNVLKRLDASVGQNQRNVGNYASAFNGLGFSFTQVARELPALAINFQTFALAISNNLPIVSDEIRKAKVEIAALKAEGKETPSLFNRITKAIFSPQVGLSLLITAFTLLSGKMFGTRKEVKNFDDSLNDVNEMIKRAEENIKSLNEQIEFLRRIGSVTVDINFGDAFEQNRLKAQQTSVFIDEEIQKAKDQLPALQQAFTDAFNYAQENLSKNARKLINGRDIFKLPKELVQDLKKGDQQYINGVTESFKAIQDTQNKIKKLYDDQSVARAELRKLDTERARQDADDLLNAQNRYNEKQRKADLELFKLRKQAEIDLQKAIVQISTGDERIKARKRQYELEIEFTNEVKNREIKNAAITAAEKTAAEIKGRNLSASQIRAIELKNIELTQKEIAVLNEKAEQDRRESFRNQIADLVKFTDEERRLLTETAEKQNEETNKIVQDGIAKRVSAVEKEIKDETRKIEIDANERIAKENNRYAEQIVKVKDNKAKRERLEKEHQANLAKIEKEAALSSLEVQASVLASLLNILDLPQDKIDETTAKLAELRAEISKLKAEIAGTPVVVSNPVKELEDFLGKVLGYYNQIASITSGAFDAATTKRKNEIQDQINLLEQQKQADTDFVNATVANRQDAAAEIAIIEARAQQRREQLEQRQKELDYKRAQFEKALSIARITIEGAQAVIHQLTTGDPATSIARAIAAGVLAGAQLAVAIATPIPRYAEGTDNHPGGAAVVGDGGRHEGIELPDGTVMKSPNRATLMDLPAGTKVHKDYDKMVASATMTRSPVFIVKHDTGHTDRAVLKIGKDIVKAIAAKPVTMLRGEPRYKVIMQSGQTFRRYIDANL